MSKILLGIIVVVLIMGGVIALPRVGEREESTAPAGFSPGGVPSKPAVISAEYAQMYIRPLLDAFSADDPEAALIAMLSQPFHDAGAASLLKDIGSQRAAAGLRQVIADIEAGTRRADTLSKTNAQVCLWMIENLNALPAKEQAAVISGELEKIQAASPRSRYQDVLGRTLLARLRDLALPESLPILRKLVEEDVKLSHYPIAKEHWLDHALVVDAIDRIDDESAISLIEALTSPDVDKDFPQAWSITWWRWKLRTVPQDQWPDVFVDQLLSRTPHVAWRGREAAAEIIGRACGPPLLALASDRAAGFLTRTEALENLAAAHQLEGIVAAQAIALDAGDDEKTREYAALCLGLFPTQEALAALFDVARQANDEGTTPLLNACLEAIARYRAFGMDVEEEAFLVDLQSHPSELIRARPHCLNRPRPHRAGGLYLGAPRPNMERWHAHPHPPHRQRIETKRSSL